MHIGESLLQQVLGDPLLALARLGGACHSHETHAQVLMVHRSKLSDTACDQLIGATLERDAQEIRELRYSLLGRRACRGLYWRLFTDLVPSRYSPPHTKWRHRLRGIVSFTCSSTPIQSSRGARLRHGSECIRLLEPGRPGLENLPTTDKGTSSNSYANPRTLMMRLQANVCHAERRRNTC